MSYFTKDFCEKHLSAKHDGWKFECKPNYDWLEENECGHDHIHSHGNECDVCFKAATSSLTSLYVKTSQALSKRLNDSDATFEELLGESSVARQILDDATERIRRIEQHEKNPCVCAELVTAVSTLAVEIITLVLANKRTDGLLGLFTEGLEKVLRRNKEKCDSKNKPKSDVYETPTLDNKFDSSDGSTLVIGSSSLSYYDLTGSSSVVHKKHKKCSCRPHKRRKYLKD